LAKVSGDYRQYSGFLGDSREGRGSITHSVLTAGDISGYLHGLADKADTPLMLEITGDREPRRQASAWGGSPEVRDRKAAGESVRQLARSYRVSPNTISRVR
jgi:hypothetical protein